MTGYLTVKNINSPYKFSYFENARVLRTDRQSDEISVPHYYARCTVSHAGRGGTNA